MDLATGQVAGVKGMCSPPGSSGSPALLDNRSQSLPWLSGLATENMGLSGNVTCFSLAYAFNKYLLRFY